MVVAIIDVSETNQKAYAHILSRIGRREGEAVHVSGCGAGLVRQTRTRSRHPRLPHGPGRRHGRTRVRQGLQQSARRDANAAGDDHRRKRSRDPPSRARTRRQRFSEQAGRSGRVSLAREKLARAAREPQEARELRGVAGRTTSPARPKRSPTAKKRRSTGSRARRNSATAKPVCTSCAWANTPKCWAARSNSTPKTSACCAWRRRCTISARSRRPTASCSKKARSIPTSGRS